MINKEVIFNKGQQIIILCISKTRRKENLEQNNVFKGHELLQRYKTVGKSWEAFLCVCVCVIKMHTLNSYQKLSGRGSKRAPGADKRK